MARTDAWARGPGADCLRCVGEGTPFGACLVVSVDKKDKEKSVIGCVCPVCTGSSNTTAIMLHQWEGLCLLISLMVASNET